MMPPWLVSRSNRPREHRIVPRTQAVLSALVVLFIAALMMLAKYRWQLL
jgi:hypothetical protein